MMDMFDFASGGHVPALQLDPSTGTPLATTN
jgi:hypothetical protein